MDIDTGDIHNKLLTMDIDTGAIPHITQKPYTLPKRYTQWGHEK